MVGRKKNSAGRNRMTVRMKKFCALFTAVALVLTAFAAPVEKSSAAAKPREAKKTSQKLSYKGYELKWEDNFDGNELNMADWNIETHEPGWVNAEWQEYTRGGNIEVKDGKLVIIPKRKKNSDGSYSYTSGRINTQNKHTYKYGIMEAKMKFPKGQGYLPAFWMMPNDENLYGQWPKCGEIDIAEVMGQETNKIYGTIHYGEPHGESQGTKVLKKGNFADEWHVCAVEWEPGSIKWYVDGVLYHEEHSWFSKTTGQGEITYPAPFDQDFYIIFNLAIGGSWVGYPDKTTDFNSKFEVDYVKVYQKDSYNEDVKKPVKAVKLKKPDKNGNYISNADFSKNEKLDGSKNWEFLTAQGGVGSASISNKKIAIKTTNAGSEDYSIQLVQPGLPMEKGATYEVSFDAYADQARTMKVDISGPDMNYMRYFQDTTVKLTTKKKAYKYQFTMKDDTDANSRLEFNMGAQGSTANVYITNIKLKKIKDADAGENNKKTILADGNLVYNGKFQEGNKRLGYWKTKKNADTSISVTNADYYSRKLEAVLKGDTAPEDVKVYQTKLAFEKNKEYLVSFSASASSDRTITANVAGNAFKADLTTEEKTYEFVFKTGSKLTDKNVEFLLGGKAGKVYLDNVTVAENSLIKNGNFNAGFTGWTVWNETNETELSYVVDSISEKNAADFTINKTGAEDWKIQLMQRNVPLEKGQYYRLKFDAKASNGRKIRAVMQGLEARDYDVYSGENIVKLSSKYKTFTKVFKMEKETDKEAQLSICLGAVSGKQINKQHRVCIDNVSLEAISEEEALAEMDNEDEDDEDEDNSLILDGSFAHGMDMWSEWHETKETDVKYDVANGEAVFTVSNTGAEDWKIQLKQENITLQKGHYYRLTFKGKSDLAREVRATVQGDESRNYTHYTGDYFVSLGKDYKNYNLVFKMKEATDEKASFQICMGAIDKPITKKHTMTFTDFALTDIGTGASGTPTKPGTPDTTSGSNTYGGDIIIGGGIKPGGGNGGGGTTSSGENLIKNGDFSTDGVTAPWAWSAGGGTFEVSDGTAKIKDLNMGESMYWPELSQKLDSKLDAGDYELTLKMKSTVQKDVTVQVMQEDMSTAFNAGTPEKLMANTEKPFTITFTVNAGDNVQGIRILFGKHSGETQSTLTGSEITLDDVKLVKVGGGAEPVASKQFIEFENILLKDGNTVIIDCQNVDADHADDAWWVSDAKSKVSNKYWYSYSTNQVYAAEFDDSDTKRWDLIFGKGISNHSINSDVTLSVKIKTSTVSAEDVKAASSRDITVDLEYTANGTTGHKQLYWATSGSEGAGGNNTVATYTAQNIKFDDLPQGAVITGLQFQFGKDS